MKKYILSEDVLDDEYDLPTEEQEYTSEKTSINSNKLPAIFHMVSFPQGGLNLDYGGGKFDNAAEYLAEQGSTNVVYDPYNRSTEHNRSVIKQVKENGGADTATLSNVLNVIQEEAARLMCLRNIKRLLKSDGTLYVTVYEGSGSGEGAPTKSGYQRNAKTADYLEEIQKVFPDAYRKGKLIICPNSPSGVTSAEEIDEWEDEAEPYSTRDIPTSELLRFADKVAEIVSDNTNKEIHCYDVYVVDYNRLVMDFKDYDTEEDYSATVILDETEPGVDADELISNYLDEAVEGLSSGIAIEGATEQPIDPPDYDEPEHLDAHEEVEIPLDGVIVTVGTYGDFDYPDWEPDELESEEFPGLILADEVDIAEYLSDLIYDIIPAEAGTYTLSGTATFAFQVEGVDEYRDYYKDEDGEVTYDAETYLDDANVDFLPDESSVDVEFIPVK